MSETKLGRDTREMIDKTSKLLEMCTDDVNQSLCDLRDFMKENKDRFEDHSLGRILDILESLELVETRLKDAQEDISDILFGTQEPS